MLTIVVVVVPHLDQRQQRPLVVGLVAILPVTLRCQNIQPKIHPEMHHAIVLMVVVVFGVAAVTTTRMMVLAVGNGSVWEYILVDAKMVAAVVTVWTTS
jgi:hypothetical protein